MLHKPDLIRGRNPVMGGGRVEGEFPVLTRHETNGNKQRAGQVWCNDVETKARLWLACAFSVLR